MNVPPQKTEAGQIVDASLQSHPVYTELPNRYTIRERDGKRELICSESPSIAVRIERSLSISAQAVRKSPAGSIYLDGAAQDGPFLDVERHVYNLDHHQGCVRSFTLATCEQAMVVVRKGLDLQGRDWVVYANEPDLDTVLAIWVLLNHIHVNDEDAEIRSRIMPLVRLQGTIDAHGLEMQELCGFPPEFREKIYAEIEQLRAREVEYKKEGKWQEIEFLEYTAGLLRAVDALVYSSQHFEGALEVEELARAEIGDRSLAIVCRSETGIYEVEHHLRRLHGKRLGLIILQKSPQSYTLRQVDPFLPGNLEGVYEQLNLVDSAAGTRRSGNRWGGSTEIGGSPRATDTGLTAQQIAAACAAAYRKPTPVKRAGSILMSVLECAAVMLGPMIALYLLGLWIEPEFPPANEIFHRIGTFTTLLCLMGGALLLVTSRKAPKLYGLCAPAGWDWLYLLPLGLFGGLLGGAWGYAALFAGKISLLEHSWKEFVIALAFPAAGEVLYRGLVHGALAQNFRIQKSGEEWFLSWPVSISTLLYVLWSFVPMLPFYSTTLPLKLAGTLLFGLAAALARERSESLVPPLIMHWFALVVLFLLWS